MPMMHSAYSSGGTVLGADHDFEERMNLAQNLFDAALECPSKTAYSYQGVETSYSDFLESAKNIAGAIADQGVVPGSVVALSFNNVPAFPVSFYGALIAGCSVVPLNPQSTEREMAYFLEDSGAEIIFTTQSAADLSLVDMRNQDVQMVLLTEQGHVFDAHPHCVPAKPVKRDGKDTAVIFYTSGTTGRPKGAMLTHDNLQTNARTVCETVIEANRDDVIISCLPLFHCFGLTCNLNVAILARAKLVLIPVFEASSVIETIKDEEVTVFSGVPTMYARMLSVRPGRSLPSLRVCLSGGAPLPIEIHTEFENRFKSRILEGYGLSETSPVAVFNRMSMESRPGSVGLPVRGVSVKILNSFGDEVATNEVGEVLIRGECVMAGYLGRPDATDEVMEDGWFRSGDLGKRDEDGYLHIVDRKKQLIIRGGNNVYPRQVEEVLYEHPAILEAAVVGIPHSTLGEEVGAAIVLHPDHDFDAEEIREFCKSRISRYQCPRIIWTVPELPKSTVGKILHRSITPPAELLVE